MHPSETLSRTKTMINQGIIEAHTEGNITVAENYQSHEALGGKHHLPYNQLIKSSKSLYLDVEDLRSNVG